jgi:hypothetical protein
VGPQRLVFEMDRRGHGTVTRSTVYRTLVRNGLIVPESRRRSRRDYRRWERPLPDPWTSLSGGEHALGY